MTQQPMQTPPPTQPGWQADPWDATRWRWWDGWTWTAHTSVRKKKPRLPGWLSVPVLLAMFLVVPGLLLALVTAPIAVVLSATPLLIVLPVMIWLDRVEPEPKSALVHSLLWGATISIVVSAICNDTVGHFFGDVAGTVISAPVVEEAMKAGGILYAVRRRELDSPMDGIIYASWTAVGFAAVEDVIYFSRAMESGSLAVVFVLRGILSPFAHPLFTAWTGLAVGRAVSRGKSVFPSILWGYALAVGAHALWNGSTVIAQVGDGGALFFLATVLVFVTLFFTFAVVLYRLRRKDEKRFAELVPWMAQRYNMAPNEVHLFSDFKAMLQARKRLTKPQRLWFDRLHAALARLALLHDRPAGADPATEKALMEQLARARVGTAE